jgi:BioD-like phosphotransacetylase family protein
VNLTIKNLYITSIPDFAGKTALCLGLALKAKEAGLNVGYFKPIGCAMVKGSGEEAVDEDVVLMKDALGAEETIGTLSPVTLQLTLKECFKIPSEVYRERIIDAYQEVSRGKDLLLIEGLRTMSGGASIELPAPKLAGLFEAKILLVARAENDLIIDDILRDRDYAARWKVELSGVVFNNTIQQMIERIESYIKHCLERFKVKTFGAIPENSELTAPSVREIYENLGGKILACGDHMSRLVKDLLVGAMSMDAALKYFRRSVSKAVITGGDRADIALVAMETDTSALILTGNIHPSARVLSRAEEVGVPVILVPYDTYTTVKMVKGVVGRIKPHDKRRIELARKMVDYVNWRDILEL